MNYDDRNDILSSYPGVKVVYPLKQGLNYRDENGRIVSVPGVKVVYPLKQGLNSIKKLILKFKNTLLK